MQNSVLKANGKNFKFSKYKSLDILLMSKIWKLWLSKMKVNLKFINKRKKCSNYITKEDNFDFVLSTNIIHQNQIAQNVYQSLYHRS